MLHVDLPLHDWISTGRHWRVHGRRYDLRTSLQLHQYNWFLLLWLPQRVPAEQLWRDSERLQPLHRCTLPRTHALVYQPIPWRHLTDLKAARVLPWLCLQQTLTSATSNQASVASTPCAPTSQGPSSAPALMDFIPPPESSGSSGRRFAKVSRV